MTNTTNSSNTTSTTSSSSFNFVARPTSSSNSYPVSHFRKLHTEFTHQVHKLTYDIDSWSSHSAQYHPRHIMVNKPLEQDNITFGKYHKVHVCNLKEFKVFGGITPNNMIELLHSGLRNDHEPETFPLKHRANYVYLPFQYIKIVPMAAWGANFNFSIWYIEIRGVDDQDFVQDAYDDYITYREKETIRLCLKHLRQRNYIDTFNSLQARTNILLEDPLLTDLHSHIVIEANFDKAEEIMEMAAGKDFFNEYIRRCSYKPAWRKIEASNADGDSPCMRGGHQMCIDVEAGHVYLLAGWDGTKDLADFWVYDINANSWILISEDTQKQGGPGPRSCHKICFDPVMKQIYVFGRYIEPEARSEANLDSDFYRYDVLNDQWTAISLNTELQGGPELIYDHQMCIDPETQILYVFGGRTMRVDPKDFSHSGLYSYEIATNTWTLLRPDIRSDLTKSQQGGQLKSRIGHSMLFDPKEKLLYIFAGQREKEYLSDFYVYDIKNNTVHEISRDYSKQGGPEAGFTQRSTFDTEQQEFYVLSGLMRDNKRNSTSKSSFWVYSLETGQWVKIYQNEQTENKHWIQQTPSEPCPRFAHQLVYDHINKVQYLFGGNPGEQGNSKQRLDDFWDLRLIRPTTEEILRKIRFHIRKQKFREMCLDPSYSVDALKFLQTQLAEVVDHSNETESAEFRSLTTDLVYRNRGKRPDTFQSRTELYETLLEYFPEIMKQPKGNLIDLVKIQ
ncbi:448_t:CDS:10 [Paraglomus occultum]|uniref:448_t:CDS:1 n=1 Tax=Paraglomus occultum TaxID=144539 RepID=A0A9N8VI11_9GLOM|nr:448_t:CDS:10 [Paraglomus occultum]